MKAVRERIEERRAEIAAHPFYAWVRDTTAPATPTPRRFDFALALTNFIMGFADLNRWFLRYPQPTDAFQRAINAHTVEDERHSALFLEDWRKLGFDEHLGWGAGETLAWYHADPSTEPLRRDAQWITRMVVENEDPLVRFALMEAIETWGHVMFAATASAASALTRRTGETYRYFGPYHLERELGTLIDGEELFEDVVLDPVQRARALVLVDGLFDLALRESDHLLRVARGDAGPRSEAPPPATTTPTTSPVVRAQASPTTVRLERRLAEHRRAAREHPLLARVTAGGDPREMLRELALFWAPDCLGYRDLMRHVVAYPDPAGPEERSVTRWAEALGTHHRLFLADWTALGMDRYLGFTAGDTLAFYGLSPHSETQRESAATFVTLAHRHPDPLSRSWLLVALQASGEAFFAATRTLALQVEEERGVRLDYFADRHETAERPAAPDPDADAVDVRGWTLTPSAEADVLTLIDTVFARLQTQMTASLARLSAGSTRPLARTAGGAR